MSHRRTALVFTIALILLLLGLFYPPTAVLDRPVYELLSTQIDPIGLILGALVVVFGVSIRK